MAQALSVEDLRLLAAVAAAGSLTAAARRLDIDHSTAFRRLGAMERRLGARLFERARDGYAPTTAGEAALTAAGRVLGELDDLERRLAGQDLRPAGVVRVTTTDTLVDLLVPVIADLRLSHPGIVVELVTANMFFTLTRRDADIAVRPATAAPEGLVARRLAGVATAIYAARRVDARRDTEQPWLGPDDSLSHLPSARWMQAHVAPERVVFRASSLVGLAAAARADLGRAPLPCFLGDADPMLVRIQGPVPEMASALWLITHPDLQRNARVRAVLDVIAAALVRLRPLFEGRRSRSADGQAAAPNTET